MTATTMRAALLAATLLAVPAAASGMQDAELRRSVDSMFAQIDTNRDGRVSRAEGNAFIGNRRVSAANRARIWRRLDANRDGFVSKAELTAQAMRYQKQMEVR